MEDHRLIRKITLRLLAWLRRSRSEPISFMKFYSYKDIKRATDDFHRIIYSNSHGSAYKAKFQGHGVSLVREIREIDQGEDIFFREVQWLGRLHHRHLLALKGFSTGRKRLLVFDNIENGSLKEYLNDPLRTPLNWRVRLQIAIDVAAALEYLLLFNDQPIHHISISSSDIMLDENFNAKLSNFGLSSGRNHVRATHDSRSEEYMVQEIICQLGELILELITGQSLENGGADMIQWVQEPRITSSFHNMVDPDLGNSYESRELKSLLAVAKLCIKSGEKPKFSIPQIVRYLQKLDTQQG